MAEKWDYLFKLLVIGDSGVGKSSLITKYADNTFSTSCIPTIGIDFKIKTISNIEGKKIRLQIWDTAGHERFRTLTTTYYRGTHGVIVVYDVTQRDSFSGALRWLSQLGNMHVKECCPRTLVGNKNDVPGEKVVRTEDAQRFADANMIDFFETSAKDNINVEEMFHAITTKVLKQEQKRNPIPSEDVVTPTQPCCTCRIFRDLC